MTSYARLSAIVGGLLLAFSLDFAAAGIAASKWTSTNLTKACTEKGGVITTDNTGDKLCIVPVKCADTAGATAGGTIVQLEPNDSAAVEACFDACGTIESRPNGKARCVKPSAFVPAREPNN